MSNSRNKIVRKINFAWFNSFPSAMSWFWKSSKLWFPENPPKMVELHNYIKSSEMVVRGWYMTHFDRKDLLRSKKIVSDRFHILPDLPGTICEIFRFFCNFCQNLQLLKNRFFLTFKFENFSQKWFLCDNFFFCETMILKLYFGIFTSGRLLLARAHEFFEI